MRRRINLPTVPARPALALAAGCDGPEGETSIAPATATSATTADPARPLRTAEAAALPDGSDVEAFETGHERRARPARRKATAARRAPATIRDRAVITSVRAEHVARARRKQSATRDRTYRSLACIRRRLEARGQGSGV